VSSVDAQGIALRIARRRGEKERGDTLFVPSDDEVGGLVANIAASGASNGTQRALASAAIKH
jgi:hypothetical protein